MFSPRLVLKWIATAYKKSSVYLQLSLTAKSTAFLAFYVHVGRPFLTIAAFFQSWAVGPDIDTLWFCFVFLCFVCCQVKEIPTVDDCSSARLLVVSFGMSRNAGLETRLLGAWYSRLCLKSKSCYGPAGLFEWNLSNFHAILPWITIQTNSYFFYKFSII